jgi:hypothetical protein
MIRMINSRNVKFLYCAPHTFYFGADMARTIRDCAPVLEESSRYMRNAMQRYGDKYWRSDTCRATTEALTR